LVTATSPNFTLTRTPSTETVVVGSTTTYTVNVSAVNGFGGVVALGVSGLPTGATGTFSPATVTGSGSTTLTVTTGSATPAGTSTVTITGTSGSLVRTANVTLLLTATSPTSGSEVTLYSLLGGKDPNLAYAGLIMDTEGNLYGTTEFGGYYNQGTVFELSSKDGSWYQSRLYSFKGGADGAQPHAALVFDSVGNLYGTTNFGGSMQCARGCGTVFKLTPDTGSWSKSVLYTFRGSDGQEPYARLVFDQQGDLYGTTLFGGTSGSGTVFRLSASSGWQESVLYSFRGGTDGASPYAGVTFDTAGNLYGTTYAGGAKGSGTVFKLTPGSTASWIESLLYSFTGGADGKEPLAGVILDTEGNLYGTTLEGGLPANYGVVFTLRPLPNGRWQEVVLHAFADAPAANPTAGLVFDAAGNLYGTTTLGASTRLGACNGGCGTLFKLTRGSPGGWTFGVLHRFGRGSDGYNPSGDLILDSTGNLWGTTRLGGSQGAGTIFQVVP
jgi:uncharacterized repeat protein (TIGR03803 family)